MMQWEGKKVTVMGIGVFGGGIGTVRYLAARGAQVTATDLRDETTLAPALEKLSDLPGVDFVLGQHRDEDFRSADVVVKNPGVPLSSPYLNVAHDAGVPVETDASIFLTTVAAMRPQPFVVGVTGTKGKTTTATLIAHAAEVLTAHVFLTSTPHTSFLATLDTIEKTLQPHMLVVAEFSSWDLESIAAHRISPPVAVITSFFQDHADRHPTLEAYAEAKSNIFRFQKESDVTLLAEQMKEGLLAKIAKETAPNFQFIPTNQELAACLTVRGAHQQSNASLAYAAVKAICERKKEWTFPKKKVIERLCDFPGLPGRFQKIGEWKRRTLINDNAATNPGATQAAVQEIKTPLVLIAGGADKKLDFTELAQALRTRENIRAVVLLQGDASEKLVRALSASQKPAFPLITGITSLTEALTAAFKESREGDAILFSPAAASFNMFANEFEREKAFLRAYKKVAHITP